MSSVLNQVWHTARMRTAMLPFFLLLACGGDPDSEAKDPGVVSDADTDTDADTDADADADADFDLSLHAQLVAGSTGTVLVSNGVPFPEGSVAADADLSLLDGTTEIPVHTSTLASWDDGSVRSVLIQFERDATAFPADLTLSVGRTPTTNAPTATPVDWTLPEAVAFPDAQWLSDSGVAGRQVPMGQAAWASDWETNQQDEYDALKGDADWGDDCRYDGYYSTTWSWYQLFVRTGDLEVYEWARREAVHYRDDQIIQTGPDAGTMNGRNEPRYLYQKALETDYLLTGDPRTLDVAGMMASYVLGEFDADWFLYEATDSHFWTERRVGFALLNLEIYGRLTNDATYLDAVGPRLDNILATQDEWPDGGYIHNLYAHDPYECTIPGTYGGSAFMTGLLFEPLIAIHERTGDPRIVDSVGEAADWLYDNGWTGSGFQYQIGCEADTAWASADLDLMIVHGFAFAAHHTGEQRYRDRALEIWNHAVDNAYLGTRKHYNQNYRSSPQALWYLEN